MAGVNSSRKKARIETEAAQIPEDVTVEILKMLPVKSLLRFRCACKTWYSDPEFYNKLHQKRACVLICGRPKKFSTVTIESLLMYEKHPTLSTPLPLPLRPESEGWSRSKFLGSCSGLVCVAYERIVAEMPSTYQFSTILWNPSTRKFKQLPSTYQFRTNSCTYTGFGYDESVDDYKYVGMVWKDRPVPGRRIKFDVFSLKSNTRRTYSHYDFTLSRAAYRQECTVGVFSNGAIHWIVRYRGQGIRILAFGLASEMYGLLEFPRECGEDIKVVILSGCLCLYTSGGSLIDLWMMKEYGVDSSWLKLASIPTAPFIPARSNGVFYPTHFSNEEGKIVAVVEHRSGRCRVRKIMRLQVVKGAVVKAETILCEAVPPLSNGDYDVVPMEETLVFPQLISTD